MSAIGYINKNPLAVIGIFAGVVEIFGNIVLPLLDDPLQTTYMWFLILFPTLLVIAFFITLNFNHKVLYIKTNEQEDYDASSLRNKQPDVAAREEQKI